MSFLLVDVAGYELDAQDKEILAHSAIVGVILFTRNFQDLEQLQALTSSIKAVNPKLFIVADQEGGRVQRFRSQFTTLPSMREWGNRYQKNSEEAILGLKAATTSLVTELKTVNINASLIPVLDVDYGVSEIIGERSFGEDSELIKTLASVVISTLHANGMPCTGKHFPGHGAVLVDSHKGLPIDPRPLDEIMQSDLAPYRHFVNQLDAIMPAHIIYPDVDDKPAGFSKIWLKTILRKKLGYEGLILSDDISMNATLVYGDYPTRAKLALDAGCDVVSLCNNREGVISVIDSLGQHKTPKSQQRLHQFVNRS